ncbi:MAG TPA: hypothetical protein VKP30_19785 [Polyangiaceae bacterium]|nr:hypothetical protein [Polyangiaceae bacterium]
MKYWPLILLTLLSAAGCRIPDNCVPQSTRCAGNVAEICNANRNWQTQLDCTRVTQHSGTPFVCQAVSEQTEDGPIEGHTCMPAGSAGAAGASATLENGDAQ